MDVLLILFTVISSIADKNDNVPRSQLGSQCMRVQHTLVLVKQLYRIKLRVDFGSCFSSTENHNHNPHSFTKNVEKITINP